MAMMQLGSIQGRACKNDKATNDANNGRTQTVQYEDALAAFGLKQNAIKGGKKCSTLMLLNFSTIPLDADWYRWALVPLVSFKHAKNLEASRVTPSCTKVARCWSGRRLCHCDPRFSGTAVPKSFALGIHQRICQSRTTLWLTPKAHKWKSTRTNVQLAQSKHKTL